MLQGEGNMEPPLEVNLKQISTDDILPNSKNWPEVENQWTVRLRCFLGYFSRFLVLHGLPSQSASSRNAWLPGIQSWALEGNMSQALQFWERDEQQEKQHAFCVMKKKLRRAPMYKKVHFAASLRWPYDWFPLAPFFILHYKSMGWSMARNRKSI